MTTIVTILSYIGMSCLHMAVLSGVVEKADYLIDKVGLKVNAKDGMGRHSLIMRLCILMHCMYVFMHVCTMYIFLNKYAKVMYKHMHKCVHTYVYTM